MTNDTTPSFEQRVSGSSAVRNDRNRKIGVTESKARVPIMPFPNALGWSVGSHVAFPFIVWGLVILLAVILGFNLDWLKPKDKKPDMTFVLVNDRNQKPPEHAIRRGEFNQRAGGKKRPDEDLAPPEKLAASANPAQQQPKPQTKPTPPKPMAKPQPQQQAVQPQPQPPKPQPKQAQKAPEKKPPMPKPTFVPRIAMPFKTHETQRTPQNQAPTGPIAKASPRQASQASPASNPAPVQIASQGAMAVSSAASMGNSSRGNPQGGKGEEGVDVMADQDYGPVVNDLTRRIRRNWHPPRGAASKRIQVKIVLARDGHVIRKSITKSSGDALSDDAALRSIEASAPFRPFPPQISDDKVTIDFDFDYNVLSQRGNHPLSPDL